MFNWKTKKPILFKVTEFVPELAADPCLTNNAKSVGMCAVPARAGWGRGRVGAYVAGFRKGAAAAGIRGGGSRVGGRMLAGR